MTMEREGQVEGPIVSLVHAIRESRADLECLAYTGTAREGIALHLNQRIDRQGVG